MQDPASYAPPPSCASRLDKMSGLCCGAAAAADDARRACCGGRAVTRPCGPGAQRVYIAPPASSEPHSICPRLPPQQFPSRLLPPLSPRPPSPHTTMHRLTAALLLLCSLAAARAAATATWPFALGEDDVCPPLPAATVQAFVEGTGEGEGGS